jgi:carbamoyl-phosphate synthase large subunit
MKFLFIAGGRRNQFASFIKKMGIEIHSYELDVKSPISLVCDKIIEGKKWNNPKIKEELFELCKKYDLVIPFHDEASKIISKFNLPNICVSNQLTSEICLDKKKFENFFVSDDDLKEYYPIVDQECEVVVKPITGVSSNGVLFLNTIPEKLEDGFIAQKRIFGKEYTLDCFYDDNNRLIDFVPRERIKVVDGEVIESITVDKTKFIDVVNLITNKLKFVGPVCFQFIEDASGKLWIIEINARMGGGCTLSIASGFDIPKLLVSVFCKKDFSISNYKSLWKINYYLQRYCLDFCYEKICI